MLKLWIVLHTHQHGSSVYPVFAEDTPEEWEQYVDDFDPDMATAGLEFLDMIGPERIGAEFYAAYVERNLERIARDGWVPVSMAEYFDSEEYQHDLIREVSR
jgi:hypothetical protein